MRSPPWNDTENRAVIALYFVMLDHAIAGETYIKAAMIRAAQGIRLSDGVKTNPFAELSERERSSIEFKLMNCSAAHLDILTAAHKPPISDEVAIANVNATMHNYGYRCLPNYQAALKVALLEELDDRQLTADIATSQANEQRAGA
jgi:hypothetical protein